MYRIVIEKAAEKQLSKIPSPHFDRIVKAIENLADIRDRQDIKNFQADQVTEYVLATTE